MGIIRKTMSVSSAGLIDFRSDKERIARSTRQTKKAVKAQTRQQKKLGEQQIAAAQHQAAIAAQQAHLAQAQLAVTVEAQRPLPYVPPPAQVAAPAPPPPGYAIAPPPSGAPTATDRLARLVTMHSSGEINDEEFAAAKRTLLGL